MHEAPATESAYGAMHGGDLDRVAAQFGIAAEELLDFSANINPAGPPPGALSRLAREATDVALLMRYPGDDLIQLSAAISDHSGINAASIIIANGAAALIYAVVRAVRAKQCLIPVPAFSEYRRALAAAGCEVIKFPLDEGGDFQLDVGEFSGALSRESPGLCLLTNPHNPSGALTRRLEVEQIIHVAHEVGTVLLLDEAFIDYAPQESLTEMATEPEHLIVLRSLTKFYGMPALRVGYGAASLAMAAAVRAQIPSWPVTMLAANAAIEALRDADYAVHAREANVRERAFLVDALADAGLRVFPSAANFLLLKSPPGGPPAGELRKRLIVRHRIVVRDCSTYEGLEAARFMRVAVRNRADNERLIAALRDVLIK
jgi:threonine-phosphate decarboxylase